MSRDQPTIMSEVLPQLVSNRYAGNVSNVEKLLDVIANLPNVKHKMIGYTSLYDEMKANTHLESYELTEIVVQLRAINSTVASAASDQIPPPLMAKYTQLVDTVWPIYHIVGRNTSCSFRNLKYNRTLHGRSTWIDLNLSGHDTFWSVYTVPGTAMFDTRGGNRWYSSVDEIFSASKRSVKYAWKDFELFSQWKLVPVNGGKYFRILNAMFNEVLFADRSEMTPGSPDNRRLFLARHDYPHPHDFEPNADLWTITCS